MIWADMGTSVQRKRFQSTQRCKVDAIKDSPWQASPHWAVSWTSLQVGSELAQRVDYRR